MNTTINSSYYLSALRYQAVHYVWNFGS